MAAKSAGAGTYLFSLAILVLLTGLTVGVSFAPLRSQWHVAAGLGIGAVKGSLVVLVFMHAAHSPRLTWCVIVIAICWIVLLFSLTYADYLTRSLVPYAPGH